MLRAIGFVAEGEGAKEYLQGIGAPLNNLFELMKRERCASHVLSGNANASYDHQMVRAIERVP